jgi:hypothetical protein
LKKGVRQRNPLDSEIPIQVPANLQGTLPLSQIDGLSVWHEARLEAEDIENIHNLATADLVELILNTKIAPTRIIDWVDQAILLTALPPVSRDDKSVWLGDELRNNAIRTASTLAAAADAQEGKSNAFPALPDSLKAQVQARGGTPQREFCRNMELTFSRYCSGCRTLR